MPKILQRVLIWQDSLEVNRCILIGSFLVGSLQYGNHTDHFHGNGHKLCIFCFRKPANSNFATKTTKRKRVNALIFEKLPKRLIFYRTYKIRTRKTNIHEANFIILKIWKRLMWSGESREAIDDFIKKQKIPNTNKNMATDLNTLLH